MIESLGKVVLWMAGLTTIWLITWRLRRRCGAGAESERLCGPLGCADVCRRSSSPPEAAATATKLADRSAVNRGH